MAGLRRSYLAFNAALGDLYCDDLLQLADAPEKPDFDDSAFFDAAGMVYNAGGFDPAQLNTPEARRLIAETLRQIKRGIDSGLSYEVPETVRHALENNAFIFSGFKAYHSLREVGLSLTTDTGEIKPFEQFRRDVEKVNNQYNHNYLYAEYNHAVSASQAAAKWQRFEADGDRYDLQYRTAADDRVREDHRALDKITLPPSDPFWEMYTPPNGWNCRCNYVQVRRGKYERTDPDLAMLRGNNCTEAAKQQIFRFNPGKTLQLFPPKHPYFKAPEPVKKVVEQLSEEQKREQRIADIIAELPTTLTDDQRKAIAEHCLLLEEKLGITKGKPMSVDEADKQSANPNVTKGRGYQVNCSATSAAFVLRELGFDIEAGKWSKTSKINEFYSGTSLWHTLWKNADGTPSAPTSVLAWAQKKGKTRITAKMYKEFYEESTKQQGTYIVSVGWKRGGGHFTVLKRFADGSLRRIEPQWDNSDGAPYSYMDLDELCKYGAASVHPSRGVMRVDDKLFNEDYLSMFVKKKE